MVNVINTGGGGGSRLADAIMQRKLLEASNGGRGTNVNLGGQQDPQSTIALLGMLMQMKQQASRDQMMQQQFTDSLGFQRESASADRKILLDQLAKQSGPDDRLAEIRAGQEGLLAQLDAQSSNSRMDRAMSLLPILFTLGQGQTAASMNRLESQAARAKGSSAPEIAVKQDALSRSGQRSDSRIADAISSYANTSGSVSALDGDRIAAANRRVYSLINSINSGKPEEAGPALQALRDNADMLRDSISSLPAGDLSVTSALGSMFSKDKQAGLLNAQSQIRQAGELLPQIDAILRAKGDPTSLLVDAQKSASSTAETRKAASAIDAAIEQLNAGSPNLTDLADNKNSLNTATRNLFKSMVGDSNSFDGGFEPGFIDAFNTAQNGTQPRFYEIPVYPEDIDGSRQ